VFFVGLKLSKFWLITFDVQKKYWISIKTNNKLKKIKVNNMPWKVIKRIENLLKELKNGKLPKVLILI
jgi:hypothetical protein